MRSVADDVAHAGGGVARRVQGAALQRADGKQLAIGKQMVELAAVARHVVASVEQLAEYLLHRDDMLADADLATQHFLQIGRGGQMIRMHMGFQ